MIYLIDDNLSRQKEAGWNETKFNEFSEIICVINNIDKLFIHKESINKSATHIFIHESFKDLSALNNKSFINDFVKEINNKAKNKEIFVVFFSGGKVERSIVDNNIINIPADIFYDNLNVFLSKYSEKIIEIKHIVYGENIQIEEHIIELLKSKNNNIDDTLTIENSSKNLIFKSFEFEIEDPFEDTSSEIIYEEEDGYSDSLLSKLCIETLNTNEYENIFLPLCFGTSLSDFNGLRLATHIRCTFTKNQLKPIFIYSVVDLKDIFNNTYINILKTKNIFLIDYSKISIKNALDIEVNNFTIDELPKEIKKLNLQVPTNYEDNHSIANEWAIYRWSQAIDANNKAIEKITDIQNSNLYFKYLKTIYPISHLDILDFEKLKINYKDKPKVLYVDDEAEKGWYEIFRNILNEKNGINFDYLDDEFNEKSSEEIIDISLKKIIEEDVDLVILDFRIHKDDFENKNIEEVTGYKILKKIKEHNKGIQVIIFSATNKIWNLQALQEAGADGFNIKESPENSIDPEFTKQSIENFIIQLNNSFNLIFLRKFVIKSNEILKSLKNDETLHKLIESYFEISIYLLTQINDDKRFFNFAYLQLFQIIEGLVSSEKHFIDNDDAYVIIDNVEVCVQKKSHNMVEWPISFESGKYILKHKQQPLNENYKLKRLDTNFKVSSTLIFRFGNENSSVLNWTKIYTNRNKAAHYDPNNEITKSDIEELLDFIGYFSDMGKIDKKNIDKRLKEKTLEESKDLLFNTPGNFKITKHKK